LKREAFLLKERVSLRKKSADNKNGRCND